MSVTTKTGDDGKTSLLRGERLPKGDARIDLIGTIDEFTSYLGIVKSEVTDVDLKEEINDIQENLSTIMAQIAYGSKEKYNLTEQHVIHIEKLVNKYESMYIPEHKFIMPGKTKLSAAVDVARSIARRAERRLISVDETYPVDILCKKYINRTSDYLYTVARYIDFKEELTNKIKEALSKNNIEITQDNSKDNLLLNLNTAKKILQRVEDKAEEMNLPVVIAVANEWGNIIAVHFMDGALPGSYSIAVDKAYTSAALRLTTEEVGKLSQSGQSLYGIGGTNNNRIITFAGGYPLKVSNKIIGGIGVSGGTAEEDAALAAYGAKLLEEV